MRPASAGFTDWHLQRPGSEPDPEVAGALVQGWMEGILRDTWHAIAPHRIELQLALINDRIPDDPITIAAKTLLPERVRRHGEQAGLHPHLIDRAIAVATGDIRV